MGLNDIIASAAARYAHALVVDVPGSWSTRARAERAVLARGWRLAVSPADADVLVVCGEPGPQLADAVNAIWHQMPGPRVRVDVRRSDEVGGRLDEAQAGLLDTVHHRHDAAHRAAASDRLAEQQEDDGEDGDHEGMDHGGHGDHEGMDHGGHGGHEGMDHGGHGGHEGMDHGDMEMSPSGIPLAEGGEDRDGLEMDVLDVRLGPVLPHWPAGLVLRCSLQGDVITSAHAELLDGAARHDDEARGPARSVDNIVSLLTLAGWDEAAAQARRVLDAVLDDGGSDEVRARIDRLARKVRRSRTLRWSLRGLRPLSEQDIDRHGLAADAAGDTYDRLIRMLDRASAGGAGPTLSADQVVHLVAGLDLATARLVVASLDIHELSPGHAEREVSHG